jgi:hypothetical protein
MGRGLVVICDNESTTFQFALEQQLLGGRGADCRATPSSDGFRADGGDFIIHR